MREQLHQFWSVLVTSHKQFSQQSPLQTFWKSHSKHLLVYQKTQTHPTLQTDMETYNWCTIYTSRSNDGNVWTRILPSQFFLRSTFFSFANQTLKKQFMKDLLLPGIDQTVDYMDKIFSIGGTPVCYKYIHKLFGLSNTFLTSLKGTPHARHSTDSCRTSHAGVAFHGMDLQNASTLLCGSIIRSRSTTFNQIGMKCYYLGPSKVKCTSTTLIQVL